MKAAFRSKYGPPGVLRVTEIETPTPHEDEILIRVHACTVNRTDCHVLSGKPLAMRLFTGLLKPRLPVTGSDFAGEIVAIGKKATSFKVGDRVMGFGGVFWCGSHAEFFTLKKTSATIPMPENAGFEVAAACCEGAFYAACGINLLKPKPGQRALVYGATGAIGSAYVQFLKYYGVQVTAVCRGEHSDLVTSLGASRVIDYLKEDFTKDTEKYDYVFDAVGKSTFLKCKRLLKAKGIYCPSNGLENIFFAIVTPMFGGRKVGFYAPRNLKAQMNFIKDLLVNGQFNPVIDRTYPLEKIAEAFDYVSTGQKVGNVVLRIGG
jgi:NADPH:quinone reductase-like Zn-dependent oxidoreductase